MKVGDVVPQSVVRVDRPNVKASFSPDKGKVSMLLILGVVDKKDIESFDGAKALNDLGWVRASTLVKFPVVIHKDPDSAYGVTVPDVPGCFSAGITASEALDNAKHAIALHFEGLAEDGEPLPKPLEIDEHLHNPDYTDGIWAFVDFDMSPYL